MSVFDKMWELYDVLAGGIPEACRVDDAFVGQYWTMVRSGAGLGLAMTLRDATRPSVLSLPVDGASYRGLSLAWLAGAAKSWNLTEASVGVAAINAYWNSPEREAVQKALAGGDTEAFIAWRERAAGKKAAVIGHFPGLEKSLGDVCELSILEKRPVSGDYPDSACEFLLPLQDFVFATGVTLVNKTLPRLLELSRNTGIILVGPSVPLAPPLFDQGVIDLQGFVVTDPDRCAAIIRGRAACNHLGMSAAPFLEAGKRVSLTRVQRGALIPDEAWRRRQEASVKQAEGL
jgi:uncharacterized protein (DUF4213/DUF364 family)